MERAALAVTMQPLFLCGPMADPAALDTLFGRTAATVPAILPDHELFATGAPGVACVAPATGNTVSGVLVTPDAAARARFESALAVQGLRPGSVIVRCGDPGVAVWAPFAATGAAQIPWAAQDWTGRHATVFAAGLAEALRSVADGREAADLAGRWTQILARAASGIRARSAAPSELRRTASGGDVMPACRSEPYAAFFAIEDHGLRFRRFSGDFGASVRRAAFVACDAVTVLPYDPARDRVLVVEQFRMGPYARGDAQPWSLEAVAGRVDPFESPEDAARREAAEEAGLSLGRLLRVAEYYPSPGAVTEFLFSYVALADLPRAGSWLGGLDSEAEDIRCHVLDFERLMSLIDSGEVQNAPLILSALWLSRARDGLRGAG